MNKNILEIAINSTVDVFRKNPAHNYVFTTSILDAEYIAMRLIQKGFGVLLEDTANPSEPRKVTITRNSDL